MYGAASKTWNKNTARIAPSLAVDQPIFQVKRETCVHLEGGRSGKLGAQHAPWNREAILNRQHNPYPFGFPWYINIGLLEDGWRIERICHRAVERSRQARGVGVVRVENCVQNRPTLLGRLSWRESMSRMSRRCGGVEEKKREEDGHVRNNGDSNMPSYILMDSTFNATIVHESLNSWTGCMKLMRGATPSAVQKFLPFTEALPTAESILNFNPLKFCPGCDGTTYSTRPRGGSGGHSNGDAMVTGLFPGQTEALKFFRSHLKCNGIFGNMNLMQVKEVLSWPVKITSYHGKKDLKMKIWGLQMTQSGTITDYFNKAQLNGTGTEMVSRFVSCKWWLNLGGGSKKVE
ncbi:hypothetical protein B0H14DRAFT_2610920 [Mycena olivaceomarginata]|nr:hypothetical protein B0H14DRAFT_2610920 [Mycena olivaceomarginata]